MATTGLTIKATFKLIDKFKDVLTAKDKARRRIMMRSGGAVRKIMRSSIRSRKDTRSTPGSVPFAHVKASTFGLRSILFDYDERTGSTIIGPIGGGQTGAPKALEFGGRSKIRQNRRQQRRTGKQFKQANIRQRPFANPALVAFAPTYPELWRESIK